MRLNALNSLSIRTVLGGGFGSMGLFLAVLCSIFLVSAWQQQRIARQVAVRAETGSVLLTALQAVPLERGRIVASLTAEAPVAAGGGGRFGEVRQGGRTSYARGGEVL